MTQSSGSGTEEGTSWTELKELNSAGLGDRPSWGRGHMRARVKVSTTSGGGWPPKRAWGCPVLSLGTAAGGGLSWSRGLGGASGCRVRVEAKGAIVRG